ncbi:MAG: translation initiation factor IF-6 [Candidatus Marsarchaeota archaeon]|nr:translation initiation factor IF-6 [Candidatus Marsarchaeota archaeon]
MTIERVKLFNTENIGVFAQANNRFLFVPRAGRAGSLDAVSGRVGLERFEVDLGNISAVGIMIVCNDYGVVLPYNADPETVSAIRSKGLNVHVSTSKVNALGNLVAVNSRVGYASPRVPSSLVSAIEDTLGVEVFTTTVAGLSTVGSSLAMNNKGFVCHPETTDEEFEIIQATSKLEGSRVTVNGGYPYVRSGIICNDKVVLVGQLSTGVELAEIESALGLSDS